jgi:hypothetical protein
MPRERKPPSQTWRNFLDNHVKDLVSIDFFHVPIATFRVLFVLLGLAHDRRRVIHCNVTDHPTARWTGDQIIQAFPDGSEPRYLLRDRDGIYGEEFRQRIQAIGIKEVRTAPIKRGVTSLIPSTVLLALFAPTAGRYQIASTRVTHAEIAARAREHTALRKAVPLMPLEVQSPRAQRIRRARGDSRDAAL